MTAKSNTAQKVPADIALIVFGTDRAKKHHASRFGSDAAQSAQVAAKAMGLRSLRVVNDAQREIARRLPKGTVSPKGRAVVPLITRESVAQMDKDYKEPTNAAEVESQAMTSLMLPNLLVHASTNPGQPLIQRITYRVNKTLDGRALVAVLDFPGARSLR